jgi:hypothetical protein
MKTKNKILALLEIAVVLCSVFLVALPAIAAEQTTQEVSASTITTASEDDFVLDYIYGNANEDDTIDVRDTTYIKLAIFGKKPETKLADANYDGNVSMLDVGQTKLIILGKEKEQNRWLFRGFQEILPRYGREGRIDGHPYRRTFARSRARLRENHQS